MTIIKAKSPCKINIFLEITAKLPNGYHELDTVFVKLDFGDEMEFGVSDKPGPVTLDITNNTTYPLKAEPSNLAVRAAEALKEHFKIDNAIHIKLTKNIPIGAGLGGGSSNAGTTLKTLARHFNITQTPSQNAAIMAMAKKLGADIPLFVFDEACLRGTGIGEKLTPLKCKTQFYAVLVYPNIHVSTADVYKKVKISNSEELLTNLSSLTKLIEGLRDGTAVKNIAKYFVNRLESAVLPYNDAILAIKSELTVRGADIAQMSGSGSTVFGLVSDVFLADRLRVYMQHEKRRTVITTHLLREN